LEFDPKPEPYSNLKTLGLFPKTKNLYFSKSQTLYPESKALYLKPYIRNPKSKAYSINSKPYYIITLTPSLCSKPSTKP